MSNHTDTLPLRTTAAALNVGDRFKMGHRLNENRQTWTLVKIGPTDEGVNAGSFTLTVTEEGSTWPVLFPAMYADDRVLVLGTVH